MKIENSSVLTLRDLESWSFTGTALAVLGHPIKHSISPAMHNAALGEMAQTNPRFADWKYFRFEVPPDDLPRALTLFHAKKFRGLNLTLPHKILAVATGLVAVAPSAEAIGAVNTLRFSEKSWDGFNTDGHGLAAAIQEEFALGLSGRPVVLLGAGGAARSAAVESLRENCSALWIFNRTDSNRKALAAKLAAVADGIPLPEAGQPPAGAIVINATHLGLNADDPAPFDLATIARPAAVYDMTYNQPGTALLRAAKSLGVPCANGLSMLVHQGARSLEIWSEARVPVETMRAAALAALRG